MRTETVFLRSAVARRVFWVVLAAAALPLLLFAALAHGTLADRLEAHLSSRLHEAAKYAGLRVYDRLVAAQTALAAMAASDGQGLPAHRVPLAARDLFQGVVRIDDASGAAEGPPELADAWRRLAGERGRAGELDRRRLWWQPAGEQPSRVLLGLRTAHAWWIAEIAPAYLWGELGERDGFVGTCVTDIHQRPLLCPQEMLRADAAADARDGLRAVRWTLFTRSDFGTVDWVFTRRSSRAQLFQGELPLEQVAWKAALFSLLLVTGLSLVLVRRTTVPLERLIDGTRRLAGRDWSARVQVDADDEFGELAGSFNQMAGRIERQVQAMQVQAGIDHEILSGMDLPRVLDQVAQRLLALAPAARVALLLAPDAGVGHWQRIGGPPPPPDAPGGRGATAATPVADAVALDPDLLRQLDDGPTDLRGPAARVAMALLDGNGGTPPGVGGPASPAPVLVVPVRAAGRTRALMLLHHPLGIEADAQAEAEELGARLAVMLVASDRERELRTRAVVDSLTGLLNRAGLIEALDQRLARSDQPFVLAFIDLDGFKAVNDTRGHPVGDALLAEVAAGLRAATPPGTLMARPGGDEFVLLLPADAVAAEAVAAGICGRLGQPLVVQGQAVHIGASIGLVRFPDHGRDRVALMRRADLAMYASKAAGRGRHAWFEQAFDERAAARAWVQSELPGALQRNELCLHFQPRVKAQGGGLASVEALVRWQHPERGLIPPMQFIALAEETGQVDALGRWVLEAACRQQRRWNDDGVPVPRVAVNVSALQLAAPDFSAHVLSVLHRHRLDPAQLEVELTESLFAGEADDVIARLTPLREAGVQIALDDFGTGFSSLSSLHRLPVDVLKIDRSFVVDLGRRESADAVARTIVALARALGKHVVAEGIETEDQRQRLLALGCDEFQGYLFARPLTPEALRQQIIAWGRQAMPPTAGMPEAASAARPVASTPA